MGSGDRCRSGRSQAVAVTGGPRRDWLCSSHCHGSQVAEVTPWPSGLATTGGRGPDAQHPERAGEQLDERAGTTPRRAAARARSPRRRPGGPGSSPPPGTRGVVVHAGERIGSRRAAEHDVQDHLGADQHGQQRREPPVATAQRDADADAAAEPTATRPGSARKRPAREGVPTGCRGRCAEADDRPAHAAQRRRGWRAGVRGRHAGIVSSGRTWPVLGTGGPWLRRHSHALVSTHVRRSRSGTGCTRCSSHDTWAARWRPRRTR